MASRASSMTKSRVTPFEDAGVRRRRLEDAALDEEDVVGGAFRHLAVDVEHDRFQAAGPDGLDLGEDVVEVVQRFDARVERVGMVAHDAGRDDFQAVLVELRRIETNVIDNDDDLRVGRLARVEAEAAGPARHDQADVAVLLGVGLDRVQHGVAHLLARQRDFQRDVLGAVVEAFDVLAEAEDLAGVDADALENAVAVEEAVVEDADAGVGLVEELAVDVDLGHRSARGGRRLGVRPHGTL